MHDFEPGLGAVPGNALDAAGLDETVTTGVPLRCHRPMRAAALTVPTLLSVFGTMLMTVLALSRGALLALPRGAMMVPALLRMRHHRRA
jgi:hypothetical protein